MEKRGSIQGRWVEKSGQRRRRYYGITTAGRKILASERQGWQPFVQAITRITGVEMPVWNQHIRQQLADLNLPLP